MPVKIFEVDGIGPVNFYKRSGAKHLRITLTPQGSIKVTLPRWVPYKVGIEFAQNKKQWILQHHTQPEQLYDGQRVGKAHRLLFVSKASIGRAVVRIDGSVIKVSFGAQTSVTAIQAAAQRGSLKALCIEAESLLPQRLARLAEQHSFHYHSVKVKHLRSKWGSCSHRQEILLNTFLMTLKWELIDYVLLHELVHTKVLRHGEPFWKEVAKVAPNHKALRKELRIHKPTFPQA